MKNFLVKIIFVMLLGVQNPSHAIALPKCSGDYDTVRWTDCFGVYEWSTGFQYSGEFKDGKVFNSKGEKIPSETSFSRNGTFSIQYCVFLIY